MSVELPIARRADYESRARTFALSQFRSLPKWSALLAVLGQMAQQREDIFFGVLSGTLLDNARGQALDQWGDLVGESRGALTDDADYRRFIRGRILANRCKGTIGELATIYNLITDAVEVRYQPLFPAGLQLYTIRRAWLSDPIRRRVRLMMGDAAPAARTLLMIEALIGFYGFQETEGARGMNRGTFARVL